MFLHYNIPKPPPLFTCQGFHHYLIGAMHKPFLGMALVGEVSEQEYG